jgi:hypothetical protein
MISMGEVIECVTTPALTAEWVSTVSDSRSHKCSSGAARI